MLSTKIISIIRKQRKLLLDNISNFGVKRNGKTVDLRRTFITKYKEPIFILAACLVLIISAVWQVSRGRAQVAHFYPSGCLGDWKNPEYAQGRPESDHGAPITSLNSAEYHDREEGGIYCGSYLPPDWTSAGPIRRVSVSFAWAMEGLPAAMAAVRSSTESSSQINVPGDNTDKKIIEPNPTSTTSSTNGVSWIRYVVPWAFAQETPPAEVAPTTPIVPPVLPSEVAPASLPNNSVSTEAVLDASLENKPVEGQSTTENSVPPSNSGVESDATPSMDTNNSATLPVVPRVTTNTIAIDTSTLPIVTPDGVMVAPVPTSTQQSLPSSLPDEHFLEIAISRGGGVWEPIAKISPENWQNIAFDLPISSWEELKSLQIKIYGIKSVLPVAPSVLLDGLTVEVEYEGKSEPSAEVSSNIPTNGPNFKEESYVSTYAGESLVVLRTAVGEAQDEMLWALPEGADSWKIAAKPGELKRDGQVAIKGRTIFWISPDGNSMQAYDTDSDTHFSAALETLSSPDGWVQFSGGDWSVGYSKTNGFEFKMKGDNVIFLTDDNSARKDGFITSYLQPALNAVASSSQTSTSNTLIPESALNNSGVSSTSSSLVTSLATTTLGEESSTIKN
jgi:hypothetical protein